MADIKVGDILVERGTGIIWPVSRIDDGCVYIVGLYGYNETHLHKKFDRIVKPLTAGCHPEVGHEFISRTDAGGVCGVVATREVMRFDTGLRETQYLIDSRDERRWYNIRELEENFCQSVLEGR